MHKPAHIAPIGAKAIDNLAYIDMLRGLAILGVLLVHSTGFGMAVTGLENIPENIEWLLQAGRHGVTLFFVVSAFTLMRSMHIRIDKEHMPMRKYFLRRFFRIAPAYYLVLSVTFFLYGTGFPRYTNPHEETLTWLDFGSHLLFVNGFFPFFSDDFIGVEWSVSTEFMFYVLLPFIFLWFNKTSTANQAIIKIGGLYLTAIALYWAIFFKGEFLKALGGGFDSPIFGAWSYFSIATHLQAFVAGAGIWLVLHLKNRGRPRISGKQQIKLALAGLVCAAVAGAYIEGNYISDHYIGWGMLIFWGLLSAALIYLLDSLRPARSFGLGWLAELGRVSFSLYLVHFPICYGLSHSTRAWRITQVPGINFLMYEIVALGLSYFIAWLLFRFVEKPGMELGRGLMGCFPTQRNRLPGRKFLSKREYQR